MVYSFANGNIRQNTVQIIFKVFRQHPKELLFKEAAKKDVRIIVSMPDLSQVKIKAMNDIYERYIKPDVHQR